LLKREQESTFQDNGCSTILIKSEKKVGKKEKKWGKK
jgi:hypothetical protein